MYGYELLQGKVPAIQVFRQQEPYFRELSHLNYVHRVKSQFGNFQLICGSTPINCDSTTINYVTNPNVAVISQLELRYH